MDSSVGIEIAFQHHDHLYARTDKFYNGENVDISSDKPGVVYLNGGSFGANTFTPRKHFKPYVLAKEIQ